MAERRKIGFGTILMVILAVCVVAYVVSAMRTAGDIPYSELRQYFLEEKVQEFSISDTRITAKLKGGSTVTSDLYDFDLFYQDLNELVQKQYESAFICVQYGSGRLLTQSSRSFASRSSSACVF